MTRRASALVLSLFLSLAVAACNRSEELGNLPDGGTGGAAGETGNGKDAGGGLGGAKTGGSGGATGGCGGQVCLQPIGASCTSASMCVTGFCVDKVCCNTACSGACMACDMTGSLGTCAQMPACGQEPQPLGGACTSASGCASGFCVDGVCCNTACAGACMTCDATGSAGTCTQTASCP